MIENLNPLSFAAFGAIADTAAGTPPNADSGPPPLGRFACYPGCGVQLRRQTGMPVLLVSTGSLDEPRSFYLDKPVTLLPGVWFMVAYLEDDCVVTLHAPAGAEAQTAPAPPGGSSHLLTPQIEVGSIYTFFYQEREKGFFFAGEQHRPYELVYVDKGRLHSVAGGQDHLLGQGDMVLYEPNQWHMQYTDADTPAGFIVLSFDMACTGANVLFGHKMAAGNRIKELLGQMMEEQNSAGPFWADMVQCHLKELILVALRQEGGPKTGGRDGRDARLDSSAKIRRENQIVENAQRYITTHLDRPLRVEAAAQSANVSASYLSALFRKHLGMAPARYIQRAKLAESKQLIQNGGHTLTEVAGMLGYATLPHFSRCFKAEFGVTPSEFAKALQ